VDASGADDVAPLSAPVAARDKSGAVSQSGAFEQVVGAIAGSEGNRTNSQAALLGDEASQWSPAGAVDVKRIKGDPGEESHVCGGLTCPPLPDDVIVARRIFQPVPNEASERTLAMRLARENRPASSGVVQGGGQRTQNGCHVTMVSVVG
jgi:hypothetical protein